ncbi:DUF692 family multinuclear iron-containing protein [Streptomyces sp. NPDC052077]|uniref:multinuclear nonheme iron-dependent oxidase n=1 Tax=Streptomyces sp. NPDC052077 TaxID=3154757 RepID=UPI0034362804
MGRLGTGIGWRPEIAEAVERMPGVEWVEAVSENLCPDHLPDSLLRLRARGVTVVPHGVSLGLGGAERPGPERLSALAARAEALGSPLVTEHIAFVRAGGPLTATARLEAGHLLPVPRTRDALDVLCENVRVAQDSLPVPLAVENIAALLSWPDEEMTEGQFLTELVERTGVRLLVDVANLYTNQVNRGEDAAAALAALPVEAVAYVHVAGGFARDGVWHDSHAHPVPSAVLEILTGLAARVAPPGVLLERDENFPAEEELREELEAVRTAVAKGRAGAPDTEGSPAAGPGGAPETATAEAPGGKVTGTAPDGGGTRTERAGLGTDGADGGPAEGGTPGSGDADAGNPYGTDDAEPTDGTNGTDVTEPTHRTDHAEPTGDGTAGARQRLALAQVALLSALVAGTPVPEGFDRVRLGVQARALAGKRADVVAKVAPELPLILGAGYRSAFAAYARGRPMRGSHRRDALDFAGHLLSRGPGDPRTRRELRRWWLERSGPVPPGRHPAARLARATRRALLRR